MSKLVTKQRLILVIGGLFALSAYSQKTKNYWSILPRFPIKQIKMLENASIENGDIILLDVDHTVLKYKNKQPVLLDPCLISILKKHRANGVHIFCLTKRPPYRENFTNKKENGKLIPLCIERPRELAELGIDNTILGHKDNIKIDPVDEYYPHDNSIIYSGKNKGERLVEFLEHANLKPKNVIFFDNNELNVWSVHRAMKKKKINSTCVTYWKCPTSTLTARFVLCILILPLPWIAKKCRWHQEIPIWFNKKILRRPTKKLI